MQFLLIGTGSPPPIYNKAVLCERFGWTLTEYDEQPADEVQQVIQVLNLIGEIAAKRAAGGS